MYVSLALMAVLIEAVVGYPDALYRRIGHPVGWIGALIARLDADLNRAAAAFGARRLAGVAALVLILAAAGACAGGFSFVSLLGLPGLVILAVLASTLVAQRSLDSHVAAVATALERGGLDAGRHAVAQIVGRDPASLNEAGVCRAAIESLAENFSDGVVAPVFWLAVAGLPGAALYKAINTADSMIGHKSVRHLAFGWAAARLDDLVNLPASRLSVVWLAVAACITPGASARNAIRIVQRDARRHASPNAGWPEAAMAGALGLALAGPRSYGGTVVQDRWMGDGRVFANAADIRRALRLYRVACGVQAASLAAFAALSVVVG